MAENIMPKEAWSALLANPHARLVDVRTEREWAEIGVPDLSATGAAPLLVSWQFADGSVNPAFLSEMRTAGATADQTLYFLCRSGVRSLAAARAAEAGGFGTCYNIAYGFEGPPRTGLGWKADGLPCAES